jgi:hypothetical protein
MALVVEDGTGLSTADSFISVADADTYFAARNDPAAWDAASTEAKEAALRYASAWLCTRYEWRGEISVAEQSLAWPRINVEDLEGRLLAHDELPQRILDATCEAALAHLTEILNAVSDSSGAERKSIKLDVLAVEYVQRTTSTLRKLPYVNLMLKGLYTGGSGSVPVLRA